MKTRALIVGSAGQDGTLLATLLAQKGYEVAGVGRRDLDVLDAAKVRAYVASLGPAEVYYLAAYHHSSEDVPAGTAALLHRSMDVHFHGVVNVLDAIVTVAPPARLFFASSSHVFSASDDRPQAEDTTLRPQSEYAISKVAGMQACQHYRRVRGVFACSGILYNHESALRKPVFLSKKIAMAAARSARSGKETLELGDLEARIDWGAATDYVEAMRLILRADEPDDYVIASGTLHSVREFADIAFAYVGSDYRNHVVSRPAGALRNNGHRVGDSSKLRRVTGWAPALTFEQMVQGLVQFEIDALDRGAVGARTGA
jgi:GDPmannose 4,6-dehydratase